VKFHAVKFDICRGNGKNVFKQKNAGKRNKLLVRIKKLYIFAPHLGLKE
jgi:hypothetical protein